MGKIFKNINEELERMKTLIYETDSLILNENKLSTDERNNQVKLKTDDGSKIKVSKISDNEFKLKGKNLEQFLDTNGEIKKEKEENIWTFLSALGLKSDPNKRIVRLGLSNEKNTDNVDKIFFTVLDVNRIKEIPKVSVEKYEQKPEQKSTVVTPPASQSTTEPSKQEINKETTPTQSTTKTVDVSKFEGMKNKKASDFGVDKMKDITKDLSKSGYGWEIPGRKYYADETSDPKNPITYKVENGIIVDVYYVEPTATTESFNMDLIFVNPLLFESIVNEQTTPPTKKYKCIGRCEDNVEAFSDAISKLNSTDAAVDSAKTDAAKTTTTDTEKTTTTDTATKDTTETTEEKVYYRDGDPYEYKVINSVWHARKKGTSGKWLDITKYKSSVDILNKEFPEAKGAQSTGTSTDSGKKTGETKKDDATKSGEETTKTTAESTKTWTRSFTNGGTVTLTSTNYLLDPTAENVKNLIELVDSLVDLFDVGTNRLPDVKDFGNFLKNVSTLRINVPSFESADKKGWGGNWGILSSAMKKYSGQRPQLVYFIQDMYLVEEGETFVDGINGLCNTASMNSEDVEVKDFLKYSKTLFPSNKCTSSKKTTIS